MCGACCTLQASRARDAVTGNAAALLEGMRKFSDQVGSGLCLHSLVTVACNSNSKAAHRA
jgi:hypothetical protein